MSKYEFLDRRVPIEDGNIALVQDLSKCNYDLFQYAQIWSENDGDKFEENILVE